MATAEVVAMTKPTSPDERLIAKARRLLGVSKFSSKPYIKRAVYEQYRGMDKEDRETLEAARDLLLEHYVLDSSAEARQARAQEEADEKVRRQFYTKFWRTKQAEKLVIDAELAAVREVLRNVYETLPVNQRMAFIKIAGNVFNLTPKETKAVAKEDAANRAKWQAERVKDKIRKDARDAYYKETNPAKKKVLWKAYLDLTKEERQAKAAAKKAEQVKITNALANVEQQKLDNPEHWQTAVGVAAKAVIGQALGRYVWHLGFDNADYMPGYWSWSYDRKVEPSNSERIQWVTMALAGVVAKHHLTKNILDKIAPDPGVAEARGDIISDITGEIIGKAPVVQSIKPVKPEVAFHVDPQLLRILEDVPGVRAEEALEELTNYAAVLVRTYWHAITEIATYLFAVRSITSRTLTKLKQKTVGQHWNKPAFTFSPAMASAMLAAIER